MRKALFISTLLMSLTSLAKYEWPGYRAKEGEHCDHEMRPAFTCADGLFCHRTDPADYWGGICRRPCKNDTDCKAGEYCAMDVTFGACLRPE